MENLHPTPENFISNTFDYLIIGGGTAGLCLANRLSEDEDVTVGVIEAGPPVFNEPIVDVPARCGQAIGTKYDWQFETTEQPGLGGRTLAWPRGKMLGGTSAMNFLCWNRACKEDYDAWEELGNPGWNWRNLKECFKRAECLTAPTPELKEKFKALYNETDHGTAGPIQTNYQPYLSDTHEYWHETLKNLGVETNEAHFGGSTVGTWTMLASVDPKTQARSYSATAYYRPVAGRTNLIVLTNAEVSHIELEKLTGGDDDDDKHVATGAHFSHSGKQYFSRASKEVILCCGSVGSPQLLELSGIGNPEILHEAGIEVKVDNANVGENLQEHMMTMTVYEIQPNIVTREDLFDPVFAQEAEEIYTSSKTGILTSIAASIAYLPATKFMPAEQLSNLSQQAQTYASSSHPSRPIPSLPKQTEILSRQFHPTSSIGQVEYILDTGNYSPYFQPPSQPPNSTPKKYATLMQILQYPFSRGSIHINPSATTNPTQKSKSQSKPIINPQYYLGDGGAIDFAVMHAAQIFGDKIHRTPPLSSSIFLKRVWPPEPAAAAAAASSSPQEETSTTTSTSTDWTTFLRTSTQTDWHPIGTCSMLPRAAGGVVSPDMKVYGTRNLRVVDASVFPLQIGAHTQGSVYAVAEGVAGRIRKERCGRRGKR